MSLRIKQLRELRGWTQETLAAKARMSRSQLAMIEKETRPANTLRLNAIAAALGVEPEALFTTDDAWNGLRDLLPRLSADQRETLVKMAEAFAAQNSQS